MMNSEDQNLEDQQYDDEEEQNEEDMEARIPRKTREHSRSKTRSGSSSSSGSSRSSGSGDSGSSRSGSGSSRSSSSSSRSGSSSGRSKRRSSSSSSSIKSKALDLLLFFIRVGVSISMLTHGMPKLEMLTSGRSHDFLNNPIGLGAPTTLFLAVVAEVFCSVLIIVGLFTRVATVPLIFTMLVATLGVQLDQGFSKMELPMFYAFFYLLFLVTGPGKYSIDRYIYKLKKQRFM